MMNQGKEEGSGVCSWWRFPVPIPVKKLLFSATRQLSIEWKYWAWHTIDGWPNHPCCASLIPVRSLVSNGHTISCKSDRYVIFLFLVVVHRIVIEDRLHEHCALFFSASAMIIVIVIHSCAFYYCVPHSGMPRTLWRYIRGRNNRWQSMRCENLCNVAKIVIGLKNPFHVRM